MSFLLELKDIRKSFDNDEVLKGIDLGISSGTLQDIITELGKKVENTALGLQLAEIQSNHIQETDFCSKYKHLCSDKFTPIPNTVYDIQKLIEQIQKKNEPRVIDLDILAFETISIKLSNLNVPHPQLFARKFVLVPWSEINPDFVVQDFGQSISTLLKVCPDTSEVNIHTMEKSA